MAKQLQIRRGTTAHNTVFTGAIGEMTVDTQRKDLRLHDGVKQGGYEIPTIIEQQLPSADNDYTWYIKYSNGWCEQGGQTSSSVSSITLPVEMADTNYTIIMCIENETTPSGVRCIKPSTRATTSFGIQGGAIGLDWEIKGLYKQGE